MQVKPQTALVFWCVRFAYFLIKPFADVRRVHPVTHPIPFNTKAFELAIGVGPLFRAFQKSVLMATTSGVGDDLTGSLHRKSSLAGLANFVANSIHQAQLLCNPPCPPGLFGNNQKCEECVCVPARSFQSHTCYPRPFLPFL